MAIGGDKDQSDKAKGGTHNAPHLFTFDPVESEREDSANFHQAPEADIQKPIPIATGILVTHWKMG